MHRNYNIGFPTISAKCGNIIVNPCQERPYVARRRNIYLPKSLEKQVPCNTCIKPYYPLQDGTLFDTWGCTDDQSTINNHNPNIPFKSCCSKPAKVCDCTSIL